MSVQRGKAVAERLGDWLSSVTRESIPSQTEETVKRLVLDVVGLCVAARNEPYVRAVVSTADEGPCSAFGHARDFDSYGAALVNGTAAHGEDFDDTFEGGPVHSGAVIVPAVLAACEREQLDGRAALIGIVTGVELLCRFSLVAPKATHRAGFHPTAVFGALAAAAGVGAALRMKPADIASALGIAGSMASGIIEYLAEGTWTKRMHAGWAAQSGLRAALMARAGFVGPPTVLDGVHGFYRAFAPSVVPNFEPLLDGLGTRWVTDTVAFKPYACGTMTQPFIDCAIQLARTGVTAESIQSVVCEVAEGTVHRLWEPVEVKWRPPTAYAAKFSTPYCMAVGFFDGRAGFAQFTDARIADEAVLTLCRKIRYVINPHDDYPRNFSGHLRATLSDGRILECRQSHMRGGAHAPLAVDEIENKFVDNVVYGGWSRVDAERLGDALAGLFETTSLSGLREWRR
ncbi:MAG: MmgE/PrpD family protein [Vicinamibacterales bacterium]